MVLSFFMKYLILFGPPGSGKGTQAEKISKEFNFKHLSTGQILREALNKKDGLSRQVVEIMNKGSLVSDDIVNQIIQQEIKKDEKTQFVFDGYPRTLEQAIFLDTLINKKDILLINLLVSTEEVIKRLGLRKRNDDNEENIKRRLKVYHQNTKPIFNYYQNSQRFIEVKGEGDIEEVFKGLIPLVTN
jgi:adenylate kinase